MKTVIEKLEGIFEDAPRANRNYAQINPHHTFLTFRRALFLLAKEIDELKDETAE